MLEIKFLPCFDGWERIGELPQITEIAVASPREVLFEFQRSGAYVKVSALDPVTLTEVSIVGSARAPAEQLKRTALQKLKFVMEKKQQGK